MEEPPVPPRPGPVERAALRVGYGRVRERRQVAGRDCDARRALQLPESLRWPRRRERAPLPAGPATGAARFGAPLLPTAVYFDGPGHRAVVRPPVPLEGDVTSITQALAHELEDLIRAAPEQWHLFQPNWPSDPGFHR